jgi:UDPglucose--hexose-1-phosphate uridylyltransferase
MKAPQGYRILVDELTGGVTVVNPSRQQRPAAPERCPFCPGGLEAPEPYELKWFKNRFPALGPEDCEVILFSPEHDKELADLDLARIEAVLSLYASRCSKLREDCASCYPLVFENRGPEVGATIEHPHAQIYRFPFVPPAVAAEVASVRSRGCPLCGPAKEAFLVFEASSWRATAWEASPYPYGVLLHPADHIGVLEEADLSGLSLCFKSLVSAADALFGERVPYMFWIHQGYAIEGCRDLHLHAHWVTPWRDRRLVRFVAAGELGSGVMFNPVDPVRAAAALRERLEGS